MEEIWKISMTKAHGRKSDKEENSIYTGYFLAEDKTHHIKLSNGGENVVRYFDGGMIDFKGGDMQLCLGAFTLMWNGVGNLRFVDIPMREGLPAVSFGFDIGEGDIIGQEHFGAWYETEFGETKFIDGGTASAKFAQVTKEKEAAYANEFVAGVKNDAKGLPFEKQYEMKLYKSRKNLISNTAKLKKLRDLARAPIENTV